MEKKFRVTGMGCAACVAHVKSAIEGLSGVESCEVDLAGESATVRFDGERVGFSEMKEAVEEAGYGLKEI